MTNYYKENEQSQALTMLPTSALAAEPPRSNAWRNLMIFVGVVFVILLILWLASAPPKKERVTANRRSITRASTASLARALHERLAKQGDASDATMRSLAEYARGGTK